MAISTRGASAWVRNTPTGLPDWTSSVSIVLQPSQRRDDAVEALPVARGPADAAIDHQLVRPLGDVGVEIVHQHPQRRFGQPALGASASCRWRARIDALIVEAGAWSSVSLRMARSRLKGALRQAIAASRMLRKAARIGAANRASYGARPVVRSTGPRGSAQIAAIGELHLHRMDAVRRSAVVRA